MDTSRRDLVAAGTLLAALGVPGSANAAPTPAPPGLLEVLHIYSDKDGISHGKRVKVYGAKPLPVTQIMAGTIGPGLTEWGTARNKRFSINVTGDLDVELGDGTHFRIGKGDLVFIEDQGGKGHRSHMLTPIANLFLMMPDDFDLAVWAGQPCPSCSPPLQRRGWGWCYNLSVIRCASDAAHRHHPNPGA